MWSNKTTGHWDVFFAKSTDNVKTFEVVKLTNGTGHSFDTRISASENNVYITWLNNKTGVNQIYMRASNDGGSMFGKEVMVNKKIDAIGAVAKPTARIVHGTNIASSGNNMYIVWFEDIHNSTGATGQSKPEVFLMASNQLYLQM
jgi:hypothetical protein